MRQQSVDQVSFAVHIPTSSLSDLPLFVVMAMTLRGFLDTVEWEGADEAFIEEVEALLNENEIRVRAAACPPLALSSCVARFCLAAGPSPARACGAKAFGIP